MAEYLCIVLARKGHVDRVLGKYQGTGQIFHSKERCIIRIYDTFAAENVLGSVSYIYTVMTNKRKTSEKSLIND